MVMARPQWQPVKPAVPAEDPLPWLTASWDEAARATLPVTSQDEVTLALSAAEKSLNSFVIGLADGDVTYRLMLGKAQNAPAATNHDEHVVFVGTKPWSHYADGALTFGQLVAVFTGLAYHEVGHIIFDSEDSESMRTWAKARWSSERAQAIANAADNVCRDLRLEAGMQQRYPGFAEALKVAMWWVSNKFDSVSKAGTRPDISDVKGRLAAFVSASRYPWEQDWTGLESLRDSWLDWAARSETADDISDVKALVEEAVDRILDGVEDTDPPPPPTTCGTPTGEPGEGKGEPGEGGSEEPSDSKDGDPDSTTTSSGGDDGESESTESDDSAGRGEEPESDDTEGEDGDGADGTESGDDDAEGDDDGIDTEGGDDFEDFGGGPSFPDGEGDEQSDGDTDGDGDDADGDDGDNDSDAVSDSESESDDQRGLDSADDDTESKVERGVADDSQNTSDATTAADIQQQDTGCGTKMAEDPDDIARQSAISHHAASSKTNKTMTFEYMAGGRLRRRTITEVRLDKHADEVYGYAGDNWQRFETQMTASIAYGEVHSHKGERKQGYRRTKSDVQAQRMLASVMHSAKRGPGAPEFAQRTGRIDRRRVGRLAYGETRVFQRPDSAAPQRVKVGILVDASGSMSWGNNIVRAAQAARDLAGAFESLPWAEGFVAAHTTAYGSGPVYIPIWNSGEPLVYMDDLLTLSMNGNEDGFAVAMTAENVLSGLKPNQRGVVIVISDGAPAYADGENHTRAVVDEYRKRGLRIVSVAISADLREYTQHAMYGSDDVVAYDSNASVFSQRLAQVIGSSI